MYEINTLLFLPLKIYLIILKHTKSLFLLKKLVFISNFNVFILMFVIYFLLLICGAVHNRMTSQQSSKNPYCIVVSHACIHAPLVRSHSQAKPKVVRFARKCHGVRQAIESNFRFAGCIIRIIVFIKETRFYKQL